MRRFGKKILALFLAVMCIATIGVISASAASFDAERWNTMKDSFRVSQNSPSRKTYGKYLDKNYLNTHHSVSPHDVNSWH